MRAVKNFRVFNHSIIVEGSTATGLPAFLNSTATHYLILAGITIIALAMRFYKLGEWSLWIDELITIDRIRGGLLLLSPVSLHLISFSQRIFGESDWSARFAPSLIGVISITVLFFPVRKLFGTGAGLMFAILLALSPWHLYWSQNARFYIVLMLFYILAQFAFFFWMESHKLWYLVLFFLFLILAFLERMVALFLVPVVLTYLAALVLLKFDNPITKSGQKLWYRLLLLSIPVVIFLLFIGSNYFGELETRFFGGSSNPVRQLLSVISEMTVPVFVVALFAGIYLIQKKDRAGLFVFLAAVVPLVLFVGLAPFSMMKSRYVFMIFPNWVILAGVGAKELLVSIQGKSRYLALGFVLALLAGSISQDFLYFNFQHGNRLDWKWAAMTIQQNRMEGDLVVSTRPELVERYLGIDVLGNQESGLNELIQKSERVWFVIDWDTSQIPPRWREWLDRGSIKFVRDGYIPGRPMQLRVYLYEPTGR